MKNKKLIYILSGVIIVLLLTTLVVILFSDIKNENKEKDYEDFLFFTNDELNEVKEVKNGYEITIKNYYAIELYDYINDDEVYKNITINGFSLDNIKSTLYIENLTRTANCIQDEKYPKIVLNDTVIEEFTNEACYLVFPGKIFIIEEKYLGILYYINENMENTLVIYNNKGEREYIRDVISFDSDNFKFTDYEENDPNYYINEYKLVKRNGKIEDVLIKNGTEQFCDMINAIGICEEE